MCAHTEKVQIVVRDRDHSGRRPHNTILQKGEECGRPEVSEVATTHAPGGNRHFGS